MVAARKLERIQLLVDSLTEEMELSVYDLDLSQGPRRPQLRVRVERRDKTHQKDGINVNLLSRFSRALDRALELEQILGEDYALEVSSPGLERALKTRAHFEGAVGELVEVVATAPDEAKKRIAGALLAIESDELVIVSDEEKLRIPLKTVERACTVFR